jgi:hypothetical protein
MIHTTDSNIVAQANPWDCNRKAALVGDAAPVEAQGDDYNLGGTILVRLSLDKTGAVVATSIARSTLQTQTLRGATPMPTPNPRDETAQAAQWREGLKDAKEALLQAALTSVRESKFTPDVVNCKPHAGVFLFQVDISANESPSPQ